MILQCGPRYVVLFRYSVDVGFLLCFASFNADVICPLFLVSRWFVVGFIVGIGSGLPSWSSKFFSGHVILAVSYKSIEYQYSCYHCALWTLKVSLIVLLYGCNVM